MSKYSKVRFDNGRYGIRVNSWFNWLGFDDDFLSINFPGSRYSNPSCINVFCQGSQLEVDEYYNELMKPKRKNYTVIK